MRDKNPIWPGIEPTPQLVSAVIITQGPSQHLLYIPLFNKQQITRKHKLTISEIQGRLYVEISPSQGWEWETANGNWNRNREYPGFVIPSEPKILRLVLLAWLLSLSLVLSWSPVARLIFASWRSGLNQWEESSTLTTRERRWDAGPSLAPTQNQIDCIYLHYTNV